jgi:hypothetical protein
MRSLRERLEMGDFAPWFALAFISWAAGYTLRRKFRWSAWNAYVAVIVVLYIAVVAGIPTIAAPLKDNILSSLTAFLLMAAPAVGAWKKDELRRRIPRSRRQ